MSTTIRFRDQELEIRWIIFVEWLYRFQNLNKPKTPVPGPSNVNLQRDSNFFVYNFSFVEISAIKAHTHENKSIHLCYI